MSAVTTREECEALDAADPLAAWRKRFELAPGLVYLDGNSLGALPRAAAERVRSTIEDEWGRGLINSWNAAGWWDKPLALGRLVAPIVGARSDEVVVGDSTSVNLFKVVIAAARLRPRRRTILSDPDSFPTDLYMIDSAAELLGGYEHRLARPGVELERALDDSVCAVVLGHVDYRSALLHDMAGLTAMTQRAGALAVWDLSHSAGAVPVALNASEVDFAVGCTYKYLNGGPGSPAFVFAASRHLEHARQPLPGWHGHARPFALERRYDPASGIARFACGTPPLLSYAALEASLELWRDVQMDAVVDKSRRLSGLLIELVEHRCDGRGVELASPRDPARRGSHLAFRHPHAEPIVRALAEHDVVADFREPDLIRFGLAPLYLRYTDMWDAVEQLAHILAAPPWAHER